MEIYEELVARGLIAQVTEALLESAGELLDAAEAYRKSI